MTYKLILEDKTLQKNFGMHLHAIETDYKLEVGDIVAIGECSYGSFLKTFKPNEELLKGEFEITAKYHIPYYKELLVKLYLKQIEKPKDLSQVEKAEKWLLERIEWCKSETQPNGNVCWCNKDGRWIFTQDFKNGWLWVFWRTVWNSLEGEFGLSRSEIVELLTKVLHNYTDNGKLKIKI